MCVTNTCHRRPLVDLEQLPQVKLQLPLRGSDKKNSTEYEYFA